eukprot:5323866-Prymnesium_polylepis.2
MHARTARMPHARSTQRMARHRHGAGGSARVAAGGLRWATDAAAPRGPAMGDQWRWCMDAATGGHGGMRRTGI